MSRFGDVSTSPRLALAPAHVLPAAAWAADSRWGATVSASKVRADVGHPPWLPRCLERAQILGKQMAMAIIGYQLQLKKTWPSRKFL